MLKTAASEEEVPIDSFVDRYRYKDFLYSRNDQYKIVELHFFEMQHLEKYPLIDYRKVKLGDKFTIHYDDGPSEIYIKSVII